MWCVEDRTSEDSAAQLNAASMGTDYWTMDSACSYHYTFHREWFTSFEAVSGDSVSLGDNSNCKVEGVGTVMLKTPNGSKLSLSNVKLVPSLKKGDPWLEKLGYSFTAKGGEGILKVSKGNLVLLQG